MSVSPTIGLARLSLECISTTTQAQGTMQSSLPKTSPILGLAKDSDESDWDGDDEQTRDVISSPTGLKYNISRLSRKNRRIVRELFNDDADQNPPQISLEVCGIKRENAQEDGIFYAFQMHEIVPCSVRIGSRNSTRFSMPRCECPDARYQDQRPCKHIIWLLDRISKQALFDHDPDSALTLTDLGFPEELSDPFQSISEIRLDVIADSLHCDTSPPNHDTAPPSYARVKEAREMVAAVAGVQLPELGGWRRDLEAAYNSATLIHRGDLAATLFSLILASHSLAGWVRRKLNPSDPAVDPFRSLQQRVSRIIAELDDYSHSLEHPSSIATRREDGKEAEGPRSVMWAATQIQHCVMCIKKLVSRSISPLADWERASAARALVGILKDVANHNIESHPGSTVDERNLYMRLVGNRDSGFILSALDTLIDQSQFIEELEDIMELLGRFGAPASYAANMRSLITRMRSYKSEGSVNTSVAQRAETPPLQASTLTVPGTDQQPEPTPGPEAPHTASAPGDGQFLTPEVPASATGRGRGGRGRGGGRGGGSRGSGAGSKRSVSGSQDRGRGSKRAR
ncbi:hypothetical protein B0T19DRAFT_5830 [Cercophora scortea]|uniref:SWIM-type domain-containing protein n=1 Tax=Cercophora scortea TaxID=314031 RepID=A0AAE0J1T7_9PEZI|nr:hypothetical protein B0T19DRAFT_5830 [Cercophora scortea]